MPEFINNRTLLLRDKLNHFLAETNEAFFALAFIRQSGINMLVKEMMRLIQRKGKLLILFANDFGATESEAIVSLQEIGAELRFFSGQQSFHPKGYIFKKSDAGHAIIGSSNLSASGLSTGIEWNFSVNSSEVDFPKLLLEFNNLWSSSNSKLVNQQVIDSLVTKEADKDFKRTIIQEDQIPILSPILAMDNLFDESKNYVVHRSPDPQSTWNFNIRERQIHKHALKGEFNLVVVCDFKAPSQKIFVIPYTYLKDQILSNAHIDEKNSNRYLFEVNKRSLQFNWHYSVKMEGKLFLRNETARHLTRYCVKSQEKN
jgi:HKD family nuclease